MHRIRILAALVTALALVLAMVGAANSRPNGDEPTAAAVRGQDGAGNTSKPTPKSAAQRIRAYWTPERMAAAKPLDLGITQRQPARRQGLPAAPTVDPGGPDTVAPAAGARGRVSAPRPEPARAQYESRAAPRPYTTLPERATSKVFFTQSGLPYVCSGGVVNSSSKNMVSTAGHCVSDGNGTWSENVLVVPAYKSRWWKPRPYGTWTARIQSTRTEWHLFSNFLQDVGYINVYAKRRNIVGAVGGLGTKFKSRRARNVTARGYPAAYPFNGNVQRYCGHYRPNPLWDDPYFGGFPGPKTMGLPCDMTGGSSGGPWMGFWHRGPYQTSVNSYKYPSDDTTMYGPYFGVGIKSLFDFATGL